MFAAKLIVVVAALMAAVSQVDARKHKRRHRHSHKKELVKDAVKRNCGDGLATFVVDGLSDDYGKDHLKNCPTDITLTIALGPREIRSRRLIKLIKWAVTNGHTLAYRFEPSYDRKFKSLSTDKMVSKLETVKEVFADQYEYDLEYVFFPYVKHHLTKHVTAVQDAGFTVFGHAFHVDKHFRKTSRSHIKHQIKRLTKKNLGAIIYFNAHNGHLLDDMDTVYEMIHANKMGMATLDECFYEEEEAEEDPIVEPDQGVKQEAKKAEETVEGGAAGFGYSALLAAGVAAFALLL